MPFAAVLWWIRDRRTIVSLALLLPGAIIQGSVVLMSQHGKQHRMERMSIDLLAFLVVRYFSLRCWAKYRLTFRA